MTLKSLISPLAVAGLLALSAAPASAALFDGNFGIQFRAHQEVNLSNLTPAQRTQVEDQCRRMQSDSFNDDPNRDSESSAPFRVTAATCTAIGLPA